MREYETVKGQCHQQVMDHTYRVITFRWCYNKAKWLVKGVYDDGTPYEKRLCTRHKNEMVKFAKQCRLTITSIEPIEDAIRE